MSLTVKSQPGTAKILHFSISSSSTPRALNMIPQFFDPCKRYALTVRKRFHASSYSHSKTTTHSKKKHYDQILNSDVQNKH